MIGPRQPKSNARSTMEEVTASSLRAESMRGPEALLHFSTRRPSHHDRTWHLQCSRAAHLATWLPLSERRDNEPEGSSQRETPWQRVDAVQ